MEHGGFLVFLLMEWFIQHLEWELSLPSNFLKVLSGSCLGQRHSVSLGPIQIGICLVSSCCLVSGMLWVVVCCEAVFLIMGVVLHNNFDGLIS